MPETTIPVYQVDAFTRVPFRGNPAAVCPLAEWPGDDQLQAIAAEMNLSETAFLVPEPEGAEADYHLRWFTPSVEVELCGHATLASSVVTFDHLQPGRTSVRFRTLSGLLTVTRDDQGRSSLDLPAWPVEPVSVPAGLSEALRAEPLEAWQRPGKPHHKLVALLDNSAQVRQLTPDYSALAQLEAGGVVVTAPGGGTDVDVEFVSRFFAPKLGINEDPVTGSAHCCLTPLWAGRLGKSVLSARQVSARGGELECELLGDRVRLAGHGVLVLTGELRVSG